MDELPQELLSRIFQGLRTEELGVLSTVSKKFSRIATTFLYSKCDLADSAGRDQHRAIKAIMHTFVARADLRALPQKISIGDWPTCGSWSSIRSGDHVAKLSMTAASDIIQCMAPLRRCPEDYQYSIGKALVKGSQDAMTVAVLSMLTNLRTMAFEKDRSRSPCKGFDYLGNYTTTLTIQLMELCATQPLAGSGLFQKVTCISIGSKTEPHYASWDVDSVFKCLRLPSLKKFVGCGCIDSDNIMHWDGEDSASKVPDVTLSDCEIGTDTIQKVLRFCSALERFECSRVCEEDLTFSPYEYSYEDLHHDLFRHHESLHSLYLHTKSCGHRNWREYEPVESFAALENLKFLEADEDVLFGRYRGQGRAFTEILPPNLQHVLIKGELRGRQTNVFEEIRKALLLGSMHATCVLEVQDGCITEAESILGSAPAIKLQEITDRYQVKSRTICSFLIYRREEEISEA